MSKGDLIKLDETTELVKISNEKYRYINSTFSKPAVKLSDHNTDIKLRVGSEYFKAHKDVLSTASDYFSAMFSHDMMEKDKDYIELKGISVGGFQIMLEYFYHGHITMSMESVQHCLEASRFFHVEWLTKVCCNYILRHLSIDNCLHILDLADTYSLPDLVEDMYCFIGLNAVRLMESDLVPQLPYDVLEQLLAGDYYVDLQEELLLGMLVQWTNVDFQARQPLLAKLMLNMKFHLMTPEELENIPDALLRYEHVKDRVDDAKELWLSPHRWSVLDRDISGRGGREVIVLISEWNADSIQMIDLNHPHLHTESFGLFSNNSLADFSSLTTCGGFLYALGGYDMKLQPNNCVFMFDQRLRLWLQMCPMSQSRENFPAVTVNDKIYAIGGSTLAIRHPSMADVDAAIERGLREEESRSETESVDSTHSASSVSLKACECYDPSSNTWSDIPELPHGMFAHAGCCLNGSIYVSGGVTDNLSDPVPVGYCYCWSPGDKEWTRKSSMLTRRQSHAMFSANNKIYVMGGFTAGDLEDLSLGMVSCLKNERYDPECDRWEAIADTPPEFGHLQKTVAIIDDVVYLLGGTQSSKYLHEFHLAKEEFIHGAFCGKNFVKLVKLSMYYPKFMPSDVPSPTPQPALDVTEPSTSAHTEP